MKRVFQIKSVCLWVLNTVSPKCAPSIVERKTAKVLSKNGDFHPMIGRGEHNTFNKFKLLSSKMLCFYR